MWYCIYTYTFPSCWIILPCNNMKKKWNLGVYRKRSAYLVVNCFLNFNCNIHLYLYLLQLSRQLLFRMECLSTGPLGKWWAHRGHWSLWSLLLGIVLGAAVECGRTLTHLARHPIRILRGGYESFSAMYHFFRTQKIIWMPQVRQGAEHRQAWMGAWPSPGDRGAGSRAGERGEGDRWHGKDGRDVKDGLGMNLGQPGGPVQYDEFIIARFRQNPGRCLIDEVGSEGREPGQRVLDGGSWSKSHGQAGPSWFEAASPSLAIWPHKPWLGPEDTVKIGRWVVIRCGQGMHQMSGARRSTYFLEPNWVAMIGRQDWSLGAFYSIWFLEGSECNGMWTCRGFILSSNCLQLCSHSCPLQHHGQIPYFLAAFGYGQFQSSHIIKQRGKCAYELEFDDIILLLYISLGCDDIIMAMFLKIWVPIF